MVKSILTATIFVSSPGDVQLERDSVQTTVAKWNARNSETRGVSFRVWAWEENAVPDVGPDAQGVMNSQIPDDYDVLVGIFWSRLGTPTGRSGSGTQEEIEEAIARRKRTGSPHVAIYFKKDNFPIDDIDLTQLERLRDFESSIKERALISQFNEIQSFESQIARLLDKKADEFLEQSANVSRNELSRARSEAVFSKSENIVPSDPYEDFGLFDLVEESEKVLGVSSAAMNEIGERTERFSEKLNDITDRLNTVQEYGDVSIKRTRPIVQEAAEEMNALSAFIDERLDEFSQNFQAGSELAVRILDVSEDFDDENGEILDFKTSLYQMKEIGRKAIDSQLDLIKTITSLPRLDVKTNQAKRRLSGTLERMNDVMRAGLERLADI